VAPASRLFTTRALCEFRSQYPPIADADLYAVRRLARWPARRFSAVIGARVHCSCALARMLLVDEEEALPA
jgi:hypothetical protein